MSQTPNFALASLFLIAFCFAVPAMVRADTLTISGQANIFGAGHSTPPAPDGSGGGALPPSITFAPATGLVLTFSGVTGAVVCCVGGVPNGPDGGTSASGSTDITSFGGISGILHGNRTLFLVGVFLNDAEPTDPAPVNLKQ